jgi:CHAT domain-containing protein
LLFFYNKQILNRVLISQGKIIESVNLKIAEKDLIELTENVYKAYGIYSLSATRTPILRTVKLGNLPEAEKKLKPETVMAKARQILMPQNFPPTFRHIVIVPVFNIGAFPFYLLKPIKDSTMFVERCSYSISPGVYDLIAFKSKADQQRYRVHHSKESDQKVLFITNPAYPLNGIYQFPDLPGAEQEIMAIKPMVGNFEELKGSHATKEAVLEKFAYSNIIYFATHGVANPRQMMDSSFLVLSGEKDPYLTAREIMNLRDTTINHDFYRTENKSFPALAILSACQTGLGRSMAAGMTGLARSFLLAGSQQVVMSLWSVDDDATAFLMSRFMKYLLSPLPDYQPAEAMRRAALDTWKKFAQPSQWASFAIFGTIEALESWDPRKPDWD